MSNVAIAVIGGGFSFLAAALTVFGQRVRRDLDACLRDRRQLKQTLTLVVSALVGLLPDPQRDALLQSVHHALEVDDEAA